MIQVYKDRKVEVGQLVKVYFNLHKKVFSIMDMETGLVLAHGDNVLLADPLFEVNEKGRLRVIKEKRKNVHAYVIGYYLGYEKFNNDTGLDKVYYNPYTVNKFCVGEDNIDANELGFNYAYFEDKKVYGGKFK